jgi:hypothetical protein
MRATRIGTIILCVSIAAGAFACSTETPEPASPTGVAPWNQRTATPTSTATNTPTATPTATPTPEPTATPMPTVAPTMPVTPRSAPVQGQDASGRVTVASAGLDGVSCMTAAAAYDWPMGEVEYVITHESGHNPFAVNAFSGACGCMQLLPCQGLGDSRTNVAAGYAKWLDGGRSFERHWYRWWR